ncbi:MAG: lamin tail domain-containing protein [Bacteroidetes bacterium]|nr:lamin tail domain-containing protein [Bacteroidota bacterium]
MLAALIATSFTLAQNDSTLILSEIMFFPTSGPNEFVELYNFSETESIDLNGYKIKYSTSSPDIIIETGEGTVLPPKSFAVIFEGDYPFGLGIYDEMIPPEALVLKISDNSFGSTGMANTSDRPVWLLSPADDTLQAYTYSADNSASFSDEKIEMTGNNSQSNWENTLNSNGTPGFQNSVTPLNFDLEMSSLSFIPAFPTEGDDVTIFTKVKNKGTDTAASYSIEIYNDANFDSTADPGELIFSQNFSDLASGDSITVSTIMSSLTAGDYQIISKVIFSEDENLLNNELIDAFTVSPPGNNFNDVVLNELIYAPSSGEPEWVELFNRTSSQLNLKEWTISDLTSTVTITSEDKFIDSNIQQIGKYSYRLKQIDYNGTFEYSKIIEIDVDAPLEFELSQNFPNPFNPSTKINYQIPKLSLVTLKVYDVLGNEVATLVNEEKSAGNYEVEFNATTLPSGIYFYKLQAGSFVETKKMVLMK